MGHVQQRKTGSAGHGSQFWPLSPWLVLCLLPLMPTELFLNRGYTVWFNWGVLAFFLTRNGILCQFLVVQGTSVCLGWYSSLAMEFMLQGTFFHLLYSNTPHVLREILVDGDVMVVTWKAILLRAVVHFFDLVAHPLLTMWCWRKLESRQFALSSIVASYGCSRLWSLLHSSYNQGSFSFHYVGHDIYNVNDLRLWYPAYIAEYLWHGFLLFEVYNRSTQSSGKASSADQDSRPPVLIQSESGLSVESTQLPVESQTDG